MKVTADVLCGGGEIKSEAELAAERTTSSPDLFIVLYNYYSIVEPRTLGYSTMFNILSNV